jgi:hypothetical protein
LGPEYLATLRYSSLKLNLRREKSPRKAKWTANLNKQQAEIYSKNERNLMDLDDDTHREDQFSSS